MTTKPNEKDYLEQAEPVELVGDRSVNYEKVKMGYGKCTDCNKNIFYNAGLEPILCMECYLRRKENGEFFRWR